MTTYIDIGGGYKIFDIEHSLKLGFYMGFTKENQEAFFNAINECDDKKIKEYLKQSIEKTSNGIIWKGDSLVKFDINGTHNDESPLIKLANKYNSLEPKDKKKAITILKDLLLAHTLTTLQHKKIIFDDIDKAIDIIIEKHEDKNFAENLLKICKTHYGMQPDFRISYGTDYSSDSSYADVTKSEQLKSDLERLANSQKKITGLRMPQVGRKGALMEYENRLFSEIAGYRMRKVGRKGEFVEVKPAKADKSDTRRTGLKPETSPAKTSASSAATKDDKAPQQH